MSNLSEYEAGNLRIAHSVETFETLFGDLVLIETTPETIYLNFIQRLPDTGPENPNAKLIARIALTWPHFARIVDLFNRIVAERRDEAKENFLQYLFPTQNLG